MLEDLRALLGPANVLQGPDVAPYSVDWAGQPHGTPVAVLRPANTTQVSAIMRAANASGTPVVPMGGNTGLTQATAPEGAWVLSLERMNKVREINVEGRIAVVESGAIISTIHDAAAEAGLIFPLYFGARGSARIGGALGTNAGGSNVLRYGNTRDLCLGLEVVLPSGEVMNLMGALHKDNAGYNLKHLLIGAEGTLGVVTAAVLKLFPAPLVHATAMAAVRSVADALRLLNALQAATGGAVEAFEYMPGAYLDAYLQRNPGTRPPFDQTHPVNILMELASAAPRDAAPGDDGQSVLAGTLESTLAQFFEDGTIMDATIAANDTQRVEMWARREGAADVSQLHSPMIHNDVAVPVHHMQELLDRIKSILARMDPDAIDVSVAHLGDGNLHLTCWPKSTDPSLHAEIHSEIEATVMALGGTFSAEHGIGLEKRGSMDRYKDPIALGTMRAIKAALDPNNIMNPGKVLP
ncbi:FAD-binding oxidoreductase [Rhodobacteraceae bacterium KMM 6894]|nr:FAD-binding oxidoreductase [Rhodobacteraceae bacterium KMM 6894]